MQQKGLSARFVWTRTIHTLSMVPRDTDQPSYGHPPEAEPELEEGWNPEENSLAMLL